MAVPYTLSSRLRLPVIASPLFIISNPDLVIAQCKAGIVGSFPSLNARPISQLDEWLARITEELAAWDRNNPDQLSAPFAVNQIVHKSNDRLEQDMELCAKYKVPMVITSLGAREDVNTAVHGWGGLVLHDIIDDKFGRKAIEKGADGLIAVAAGAGGHAGRLSPIALVQELRRWFDGMIALSGASSIRFEGAAQARASVAALDAIAHPETSAILIAPSNPYLSIDPILAVPGIREALRAAHAPVVAVSPIVGGKAVKGPTAKLMAELGEAVTPSSIAAHYSAILDGLLIDERDDATALHMPWTSVDTLMVTLEDRARVASAALAFASQLRE